MTFEEWIDTYLDDEKDTLCLMDAWKAGAKCMFLKLSDLGYIDETYVALAEEEVCGLMEDKT